MYSKKLEELAQQRLAEQERSRIKEKRRENRKKPGKPSAVVNADGWNVYARLYPHGYNIFFWVFIVLTFGFASFMVYWTSPQSKWALITGIVLTGAYLVRWGGHWLLKILRYKKFKTWRSSLPFELKGWDAVWTNKEFTGYRKWYENLVITVQTRSSQVDLAKAIHNSFIIFTTEANKCFYEPNFVQSGFSGDLRKEWTLIGNEEAKGSANQSVLGEIYVLIDQHLRMLHQEMGGIQSVNISTDGHVYTVDPVEISSD